MKTVTRLIISEDKYISPNICIYEDTKSGKVSLLDTGTEGLHALACIGIKIKNADLNSEMADFILSNCYKLHVTTYGITLLKYLKMFKMIWSYLLLKSKGFYQFSINGFKIYSSSEEIRIKNGKTIFYSKPVLKVNDTYVFKNNQALPFFSLVNEGILSVNINKENENPFELQNKIAEKITNNKVRIFENLNVNKKIENLKVEYENNDNIKYVKVNPNKEAFLEFKVSNLTNDINYMYIKKFNQNTLVEINGINNPYEFGGYNKIFRLNNDDIVKISLKEKNLIILKNNSIEKIIH